MLSVIWANVCREKVLLLGFVYKFGQVAASAISFPLSDVILAQIACPLSGVMFYLHSG